MEQLTDKQNILILTPPREQVLDDRVLQRRQQRRTPILRQEGSQAAHRRGLQAEEGLDPVVVVCNPIFNSVHGSGEVFRKFTSLSICTGREREIDIALTRSGKGLFMKRLGRPTLQIARHFYKYGNVDRGCSWT